LPVEWGERLRNYRLVILMAAILIAALTVAFWNYTQDDVFITYTYSRNIAQGVGFVFNPGERVQGTTTPLWALVMGGAYRATPNLLHAGNVLSGLCLFAAALLAFNLLQTYASFLTAFAAVVLLATSPLIYASYGMETLLYGALLLLAFWFWSRNRRTAAILSAAALTWTRADGVVLGGTLCLLALLDGLRERRFLPTLRLGLIYTAAIAPWFIFAWLYFGSPLPNTFSAKQEFLRGIEFVIQGIERWRSFYGGNPVSLLALIFVPVGAWRIWRSAPLRPIVVWSALYALGYTALNITNFWYYTPLVMALTLLAVLGAETIAHRLIAVLKNQKRLITAACLLLLIVAAGLNIVRALELAPPPPRMATYRLVGEWINAHTPAESTLLVADLGVTGYYARRHTFDSFGLITPELETKTPEYSVQNLQPDLMVATQYFFWDFTRNDDFRVRYLPLVQISTAGDVEFSPMTVFARRDHFVYASVEQSSGYHALDFARWGGFAELRGFLADSETWAGGTLRVTLNWQALRPADRDYTIFVHVLDASGQIVAQHDGMPREGQRLTTGWQAREIILDDHFVLLPPGLPEGEYALRVGWYDGQTNERVVMDSGADSLDLPFTVRNRFPGGVGVP
jgi:arabinofuranosyltransferase